jgi:lipoprotein-anchoring transpeptidase ErfK/SrfK
MLTFDHPITDKAAVERSLSSPPPSRWSAPGTGTAASSSTSGRGTTGPPTPRSASPATWTAWRARRACTASTTSPRRSHRPVGHRGGLHHTHKTQIYVGGKLAYTWPISTGKTVMPTPDGTYLTVEKNNPVRMIGGTKGTPGYYNELVNWAVRFTFSGDYYHSAPWSVVDQGTTNVSHGCVNLPPADAETYYSLAIPATRSRSPTARRPATGTTAGPSGSCPGRSTWPAAPPTWRSRRPERQLVRQPAPTPAPPPHHHPPATTRDPARRRARRAPSSPLGTYRRLARAPATLARQPSAQRGSGVLLVGRLDCW